MSGGKWDYSHFRIRNDLQEIADDAELIRRMPKLASALSAVGTEIDKVVHAVDYDLSGDSYIKDDAAFEEASMRSLASAVSLQVEEVTTVLQTEVTNARAVLKGIDVDKACKEFLVWRKEVDSDELVDTFDLALGWFSGKGFKPDYALALSQSAVHREAGNRWLVLTNNGCTQVGSAGMHDEVYLEGGMCSWCGELPSDQT